MMIWHEKPSTILAFEIKVVKEKARDIEDLVNSLVRRNGEFRELEWFCEEAGWGFVFDLKKQKETNPWGW
jgi:hypothetical protein